MKLICLVTCLLFFTLTAVSQTKPLKLSLFPERENNNACLFQGFKNQTSLLTYQSFSTTIKILPLDNMPCLVPDVSSIAPMPILKLDHTGQKIPNPYFGSDLFPVLTDEKVLPGNN